MPVASRSVVAAPTYASQISGSGIGRLRRRHRPSASTDTATGSPTARRRARPSTTTRSRALRRAARPIAYSGRRRSGVGVHEPNFMRYLPRCELGSWGRPVPRARAGGSARERRSRGAVRLAGGRQGASSASPSSNKEWGDRVAGRCIACDNAWACDAPVVILAVHADSAIPTVQEHAERLAGQDRRVDGEQPREARQRVQRGAAAARFGRGRDPGAAVALARVHRVPPRARGRVRRRSTTTMESDVVVLGDDDDAKATRDGDHVRASRTCARSTAARCATRSAWRRSRRCC